MKNVGVDPDGLRLRRLLQDREARPSRTSTRSRASARTCSARRWTSRSSTTSARSTTSSASSLARRLAREEGIFAGGSSGAAVHVAVRAGAARSARARRSSSCCPTAAAATSRKFYSDEWMRDNGFLDPTDRAGHRARPAAAASGAPVIHGAGRATSVATWWIDEASTASRSCRWSSRRQPLIGMVHEYDLLNALVEGEHKLDGARSISSRCAARGRRDAATPRCPRCGSFSPRTTWRWSEEGEQVVAIVTKIDLIEWLGTRVSVR